MKSWILVLLLLTPQARATCTQPVQKLEQGQSSPCSGFLFSDEKEVEVRIKVIERNYYKELYEKSQQLNVINETRLDLQLKKNQELAEYLDKKKDWEQLKLLGSFVLGSFITAFIASNLK